MILKERLEERANVRCISQAELARRVNMTQSAVNQLFTGVSRTSRKIGAIARELRTTPEYLEGLTDDPTESFAGEVLTEVESEWLDLIRGIAPREREALLTLARSLSRSAVSSSVHSTQQQFRAD